MNKTSKRVPKPYFPSAQTYAKQYPEVGLTEDELRKYLGDYVLKRLGDWMDGQTCALTPDRKILVYPYDIDRYLAAQFEGEKLYWD